MNNPIIVENLDKAITDLSCLYESCDKNIENQVWAILQTVCDARKSISEDSQAIAETGEKKPLAKKTSKSSDISNELFEAELIATKLGGMIDLANQHFFTDEDEDNLQYVMFAVLDDYAGQMRNILQEIKSKVTPCNR
ncbi:hypothetical protein AF97_05805 [Salmonella enterica]|nr:hypothetical protein [Salmonella enterica]